MSAPIRRGTAAAVFVVVLSLLLLHACRDAAGPTAPNGTPNGAALGTPALSTTTAASQGQWAAPFGWPIVAVHLALLPTGRVLAWGHKGYPYLWNPAYDSFKSKPSPSLLFCAGQAGLADGRLLVVGGHYADYEGLPNANIYTAEPTGMWTAVTAMHYARWYPTATTLADGSVVVLAGTNRSGANVLYPEVWTGSGWRVLTSASHALSYYPRSFLAPNGRLFVAGPDQPSRWLSTSGTGAWTTGPSRLVSDRDYGAAVMYAPGKILYVGGGDPPTRAAETIDLNQSSPAWRATGSMAYARRHLNATVLPTGDVLVTTGVGGSGFNDLAAAVYHAELWHPASGTWTTLASARIPRGYHSTAVLLADGRVLVAGSGDAEGDPDQLNGELFSPPYLFAGARPVIASAPASVGYGQSFTVSTAQASAIAAVSLVRLGATTHAFDENQRFVPLGFTRGTGSLTVRAPSGGGIAPPGVYLLFIVNGSGVPSVATMLRVG